MRTREETDRMIADTQENKSLIPELKQVLIDKLLKEEMVPIWEENRKAVIDALCFIPILIGLLCGTKFILLPILFA